MTLESLPAWAALPAALLLILGGLCTAIGALGLARLGTFYQRMHGPSLGSTLGTGCVLTASILVSTALANRPVMHELLITVFIVVTAPMTAMLLMGAAVHRSKGGRDRGGDMNLQQAMKNPMRVFGTPEALEASTEFATAEKRAILMQWKDQLQQLLIADEESMLRANAIPGANAECLRRITDILTRLPRQESI